MRVFLLLIFFCFFQIDPADAQRKYYINLTGLEEVPRVRTPAMGQMAVWLEEDSLHVSGEFENLKGHYLASYIHYGEHGERGNRIFDLNATLSENQKSGTFRKEENIFHLNASLRAALANGHLYLNIASSQHQHGEIRGQIPPIK